MSIQQPQRRKRRRQEDTQLAPEFLIPAFNTALLNAQQRLNTPAEQLNAKDAKVKLRSLVKLWFRRACGSHHRALMDHAMTKAERERQQLMHAGLVKAGISAQELALEPTSQDTLLGHQSLDSLQNAVSCSTRARALPLRA